VLVAPPLRRCSENLAPLNLIAAVSAGAGASNPEAMACHQPALCSQGLLDLFTLGASVRA